MFLLRKNPSHSGLKRGCATVSVLSEWSASRGETGPVSLNPSRVGLVPDSTPGHVPPPSPQRAARARFEPLTR